MEQETESNLNDAFLESLSKTSRAQLLREPFLASEGIEKKLWESKREVLVKLEKATKSRDSKKIKEANVALHAVQGLITAQARALLSMYKTRNTEKRKYHANEIQAISRRLDATMKSFDAGTILQRPKRTKEADALRKAIATKKKTKRKRKPAPRRRK